METLNINYAHKIWNQQQFFLWLVVNISPIPIPQKICTVINDFGLFVSRKDIKKWFMIGKLLCNFNFIPKTWECRAPGPICQAFRYRMCTLKQIPNSELIWEKKKKSIFKFSYCTLYFSLFLVLTFVYFYLLILLILGMVCVISFIKLVYTSFKAIVLVDLNEFPSIFQKVQHSHSRHQKTTSNRLRINLKGILKFNEIWPLEGAMYITLWWIFGGIPKILVLCSFLKKIDGFRQKFSQGF